MFIVVNSILFVVRHKLLTLFALANNVVSDEFLQDSSVGHVDEVEVEATLSVLDINTFFLHVVFHNKLLQKKECSLVSHLLSHLNLRVPFVRSVCGLTIFALKVLDIVFNNQLLC